MVRLRRQELSGLFETATKIMIRSSLDIRSRFAFSVAILTTDLKACDATRHDIHDRRGVTCKHLASQTTARALRSIVASEAVAVQDRTHFISKLAGAGTGI